MNAYRVLAAVVMGSLVLPGIAGTSSGIEPAGVQSYYDPLLYSHAIVKGTVTHISYEDATYGDWGLTGGVFARRPAKVIRLRIAVDEYVKECDEVVDDKHLEVVALQGKIPPLLVGQRVIVCILLNESYQGGTFMIPGESYLFAEGDLGWVKVSDKTVMTETEIQQRVSSADLSTVAKEAELVIVGKIAGTGESKIVVGDKTAVLEVYTVNVETVAKGNWDGDEIDVVMIRRGDFTPEWIGAYPTDVTIGGRWYFFLKEGEFGYYPIHGMNGMLRIEGKELVYDQRVHHRLSPAAVDRVIMEAADGED